MEEVKVQSKESNIPIEANFFSNSSGGKLLVIVGGSGDDKDNFNNLVKLLAEKGLERDVVTFSFRGLNDKSSNTLNQTVKDLKDILNHFVFKKGYDDIAIVCTSIGAYSTSFVLIDKELEDYISNTIFLDPADYYVKDEDRQGGSSTWNGSAEFKPDSETAGNRLKDIDSKVVVHVIHLTIRNHRGPEGYAPPEERGEDNPKLFARLNNDMVKAFYTNTPEENRGKYIEDNKVPHAFVRDGDVEKNEERVAELIIECLEG